MTNYNLAVFCGLAVKGTQWSVFTRSSLQEVQSAGSSKKQLIVALYTSEAEYVALSLAAQEAVWL